MVAFLLAIGIFCYFLLLGLTFSSFVNLNVRTSQRYLLAPALGISVQLFGTFVTNRMGIPVRISAPCFFALGALLILKKRKEIQELITTSNLTLSFGVLFGSLLITWPMLKFGFAWLSYANDDMTNYVLGAKRFYNHGFFDAPNFLQLNSGMDYSQAFYYFHAIEKTRPGSELLLSSISWLLQGDGLRVFMPLLLALNLSMICAILAMSNAVRGSNRAKLIATLVVLSCLPLIGLGFLYQLIGQIGGLCLGIALVALYAEYKRDFEPLSRRGTAYLGLLLASLLIWYPELVPFVIIPIVISEVISLYTIKKKIYSVIISSLIVMIVLGGVLGPYLFDSLRFLIKQLLGAQIASTNLSVYLFPYYLVPHGLPSLLGLTPLNIIQVPTREALLILVSALFFVVLLLYLITSLRKFGPIASLFLVMTAAFFILLYGKSGFGTFKLAMYIQPVLAVILAHGLIDFWKWLKVRRLRLIGKFTSGALLACMVFLGFTTQQYYVQASTGERNLGFSQLSGGSSGDLSGSLTKTLATYTPSMGSIVSSTSSIVLAKIETIQGEGIPLYFTSHDFFTNFYADKDRSADARIKFSEVRIFSTGGDNTIRISKYQFPKDMSSQYFLTSQSERTIFNNQANGVEAQEWQFELTNNLENHLIFVSSQKGQSYFGADRNNIGLYESESDPMHPNSFMQAIGKQLVAQVISPTTQAHLVVSLSSTLLPQQERILPLIAINTANGTKLPIVGRGSARVETTNFTTEKYKGRDYLQLMFLREPKLFPWTGNSVTQLYGRDIPIDTRFITTFGKNISLISHETYSSKAAPTIINNVPVALQEDNLYYSGVYEDGWVAEDSYFILNGANSSKLSVRGQVPNVGNSRFQTTASVYLDDELVGSKTLALGDFRFDIDLLGTNTSISSRSRVSLRFTETQKLGGTDGRPVSALINSIGFSK